MFLDITWPGFFYSVFYIDETYLSLFKHGHWMLYGLEYVLFPALLFYLIIKMIRKEERSSAYMHIKYMLEIFARNWVELSFIFLLSWIAFELRIYSDLQYHEATGAKAFISPFILSLLTFILSGLVFCVYYIVQVKKLSKFENRHLRDISIQIQMASLPIFLALHLILIVLLYYMPVMRIILSMIFLVLVMIHTFRRRYPPGYLWDEGRRLARYKEDKKSIELVVLSIYYFLESSKAISYKANLNRKAHNLVDAQKQCLFLITHLKVGTERPGPKARIEGTDHQLAKGIANARKVRNREIEELLTNARNELRDALNKLRDSFNP